VAVLTGRPHEKGALGADLFDRPQHPGQGFLVFLNGAVGEVGEMLLKKRRGIDDVIVKEQAAGQE
jgi:hypothetical protein